MRLEQIAETVETQKETAGNIAIEAGENRYRALEVRALVSELRREGGRRGVDSEGVREAAAAGDEAAGALLARGRELREQHEALLAENARLSEQCERALRREQALLDWGSPLMESLFGAPRGHGLIADQLRRTLRGMKDAVRQTTEVQDELRKARRTLEATRIETVCSVYEVTAGDG